MQIEAYLIQEMQQSVLRSWMMSLCGMEVLNLLGKADAWVNLMRIK